jgi:hypothetical protein
LMKMLNSMLLIVSVRGAMAVHALL